MLTKLRKIFRIKEKNKTKKKICFAPFFQFFVSSTGEVSFCPISSVKNLEDFSLGNLSEFSNFDFLNSAGAKKYRNNIKNNNFQNCNFFMCYNRVNFYMQVFLNSLKKNGKSLSVKMPQVVIIGDDIQFFSNCIDDETPKILSDLELRKKIIDLLKNAKELVISFKTELFSNKEVCDFIKEVANKCPDLMFNIVSNGILFHKVYCDELGITNRLSNVCILIDSAFSEPYNNEDYSLLKDNLMWLSSLKQNNNLSNLFLSFCVDEKNYNDMPQILAIAKEYNAFALFRRLQLSSDFKDDLKNSELIYSPLHKDYHKFVDILSSQEFNTDFSALDSFFNLIRDKY